MELPGKRKGGRAHRRLMDAGKGMQRVGVIEEEARDNEKWR